MKEKEEIILSDLSKRFLEAMETLSVTGYRLKQDGIINNEATLTKIKKGIQQPSRKTIELFCEKYNINKAWIYTGQGNTRFVLSEDEDCQQNTPTPKESLQYEAPTFNEMLRVITLLSEQGKENSEANKINAEANKINAEANERNSKNMEKMVNMLERMIGKENPPMEDKRRGRA